MKDLESASGTSFVCVGVFLARWALDLLTVTWLMERHFTAESFHGLWSHFRNLTLFSSVGSCGLIAAYRADGKDISTRTLPETRAALLSSLWLHLEVRRQRSSLLLFIQDNLLRVTVTFPSFLFLTCAGVNRIISSPFLKWHAGKNGSRWETNLEIHATVGHLCCFKEGKKRIPMRFVGIWRHYSPPNLSWVNTWLHLYSQDTVVWFQPRFLLHSWPDLTWLDSHFSLYPERTGKMWCHIRRSQGRPHPH